MTDDLIKLTDADGRGHGLRWGPGVTHTISLTERGTTLGAPGLLHAFPALDLALLLCGLHLSAAAEETLAIWRASGGVVAQDGLRAGCHALTTVEKLVLPAWFADPRTREGARRLFAWSLVCALRLLCDDPVLVAEARAALCDGDAARAVCVASLRRTRPARTTAEHARNALCLAVSATIPTSARPALFLAARRALWLCRQTNRPLDAKNLALWAVDVSASHAEVPA